jgi:hypothetical protein
MTTMHKRRGIFQKDAFFCSQNFYQGLILNLTVKNHMYIKKKFLFPIKKNVVAFLIVLTGQYSLIRKN